MEWRLTAAEDGSSAGGEAGVSFTQLPTGRTEAGAVVSAVEVTGSRDLDTVAIECRVTNRAGAGLRQMVAHRVGTSLHILFLIPSLLMSAVQRRPAR